MSQWREHRREGVSAVVLDLRPSYKNPWLRARHSRNAGPMSFAVRTCRPRRSQSILMSQRRGRRREGVSAVKCSET